MIVAYHFEPNGGFIAHVPGTSFQGYAYPTSPHADRAAKGRQQAAATAEAIIRQELDFAPSYVRAMGYDAMRDRAAERMAAHQCGPKCGSEPRSF